MTTKAKRRSTGLTEQQVSILEAAARAFARSGYATTTMQDIATEAGYTVPTLYAYFEGKQHIFESLLELVISELFRALDEVHPAGLSFAQRVELLLRRMYEVAERRKDALAFFIGLSNGMDTGPERRDEECTHEQLLTRLSAWMEEASGPSSKSPHSGRTKAVAFSALSNAILEEWFRGGAVDSLQLRVPLVLDLYLRGVEPESGHEEVVANAHATPRTRRRRSR